MNIHLLYHVRSPANIHCPISEYLSYHIRPMCFRLKLSWLHSLYQHFMAHCIIIFLVLQILPAQVFIYQMLPSISDGD